MTLIMMITISIIKSGEKWNDGNAESGTERNGAKSYASEGSGLERNGTPLIGRKRNGPGGGRGGGWRNESHDCSGALVRDSSRT